jgi:hypothetical protein
VSLCPVYVAAAVLELSGLCLVIRHIGRDRALTEDLLSRLSLTFAGPVTTGTHRPHNEQHHIAESARATQTAQALSMESDTGRPGRCAYIGLALIGLGIVFGTAGNLVAPG